jgi:uncharacterized protein YndB with AHSA1/START domain
MNTAVATPIKLELSRHFDAPPEQVFDAWLGKSWGEFVGPPGIRGEVTLLEPRVGGRYEIVMHRPDGGTITVGGVYREIARPSRIVLTWKWSHEEPDTLITLTFKAMDGGTDLTLLHEGFAAAERRDSHNNGWTGTMDKLATWLKARK